MKNKNTEKNTETPKPAGAHSETQPEKGATAEGHTANAHLVAQDQPLKRGDRDVDPSDPRHSSLQHR